MIWFGAPKNVIKKDINEYDSIEFTPKKMNLTKIVNQNKFEMIGTDHLFGLYYMKFDGVGKLIDSAIFEAILYDPIYYASVLKETGHQGRFVKKYVGYFDKFKQQFEQEKKEMKYGRY